MKQYGSFWIRETSYELFPLMLRSYYEICEEEDSSLKNMYYSLDAGGFLFYRMKKREFLKKVEI